jgi:hypothetical protein
MSYTVWSRGRLLGETDLGFVFRFRGVRCGWFVPTESGERLMPSATGVGPALRSEHLLGSDATGRADLLSAVDQEEALELVLKGPDGAVIATEDIGIIDTHYLLSVAESGVADEEGIDVDEEVDVDVELLDEDWSRDHDAESLADAPAEATEFPRYQIQVHLVDHGAVP